MKVKVKVKGQIILIIISALILLLLSNCSSVRPVLGMNYTDSTKPISNPFGNYRGNQDNPNQTMILRTKKGDRSVELQIPGGMQDLTEFVLPVSPAFKDLGDSSASTAGPNGIDETYKNHPATMSDREITNSFPHGTLEDEQRRKDIEQGLNLVPNEDDSPNSSDTSYLAGVDRVKQLYRLARFEAALLETDEMIRQYQTDAHLFEMRGTLLDRLGRRELALEAWNQALRFNPKNNTLRKFIDRKQSAPNRETAGSP